VWVHSTAKADRHAASLPARREAGVAAIETLAVKVAGPRGRFKTRVAVEQAATAALTHSHAEQWVTFTVAATITKAYKQKRAGRPGPATNYREILTSHFTLHADIALVAVSTPSGPGVTPNSPHSTGQCTLHPGSHRRGHRAVQTPHL